MAKIGEHLKSLQHSADFLVTLANHKHDCEEGSVTLSLDTCYFLAATMDMAVDTLSAKLGLLKYANRPKAV